jgi:ATP-binding protein involved in chromosome partitioning
MTANEVRITEEQVLAALSEVQEPELNKDLVSLGMVKNISIDDTRVRFEVELTTPACPLRDQIQQEAQQAVAALEGVEEVTVQLTANVPSSGQSRGVIDKGIKNAIAVGSGKGGVGKTTIAVNLAVSLANAGAKVGLMDADIYGPNVPTMMGVENMPEPKDQKMIPAEAYGVKVMSIAFLVRPDQPLIWRGPMLHSAIRQFIADVDWGELDYLIIDLPPGTGDAPLSVSQSIPLTGSVIVTLPQKVSLEDARRGIEMFRAMEIPVLGIVENMSYLELPDKSRMDIFGAGGGEQLAEATGVPFVGSIPMDAAVREGSDEGVPILISDPDSPAGKAFVDIAQSLAAKISVAAMTAKSNVIPLEIID